MIIDVPGDMFKTRFGNENSPYVYLIVPSESAILKKALSYKADAKIIVVFGIRNRTNITVTPEI